MKVRTFEPWVNCLLVFLSRLGFPFVAYIWLGIRLSSVISKSRVDPAVWLRNMIIFGRCGMFEHLCLLSFGRIWENFASNSKVGHRVLDPGVRSLEEALSQNRLMWLGCFLRIAKGLPSKCMLFSKQMVVGGLIEVANWWHGIGLVGQVLSASDVPFRLR